MESFSHLGSCVVSPRLKCAGGVIFFLAGGWEGLCVIEYQTPDIHLENLENSPYLSANISIFIYFFCKILLFRKWPIFLIYLAMHISGAFQLNTFLRCLSPRVLRMVKVLFYIQRWARTMHFRCGWPSPCIQSFMKRPTTASLFTCPSRVNACPPLTITSRSVLCLVSESDRAWDPSAHCLLSPKAICPDVPPLALCSMLHMP